MTPEDRKQLEALQYAMPGTPLGEAAYRVLAALDKAEGERGKLLHEEMLEVFSERDAALARATEAEAESARLRAIIQRGVNWLDGKGTKVGGLYSFDVQFFDLALDDLRAAVASPTQPAPAGECSGCGGTHAQFDRCPWTSEREKGAEDYAYRVDMDGREPFRAGWDAARAFLASSPAHVHDWQGGYGGNEICHGCKEMREAPAQEEKRWTLTELKERFYAAREPGAWDWCRWDDFEASLVRGASWMDTYSNLKETT